MKQIIAKFFIFMSLFALLASCGKDKEDEDIVTGVATNMGTISNNLVPNSLNLTTSLTLKETMAQLAALAAEVQKERKGNPYARTLDNDLCAGLNLFACQPVLLRFYVFIAKSVFDMCKTLFSSLATALKGLEDGESGSAAADTGTVYFSKTSSTVFSVLLKNAAGASVLYASVNAGVYTFKLDLAQTGDASAGNGSFEVSISFTDASNFSVNLFSYNGDCDDDDPRAPNRVQIGITKVADLWKGKAMMWSPRWAKFPTIACSDTADTYGIALYTDFVGDSTAAKADVLLMPNSVTDMGASAIAGVKTAYGLNKFCANFWQIAGAASENACKTGVVSGVNIETAYPNPFCNLSNTLTATWNDTCSATSTAVSSAEFGDASLWVAPSTFYVKTVTMPSSL